ncbi:hypothetical protein [Jannaschia donghaensis]|uniref:Uncharacterized protein n=1 Tax=Jannaschia donghaensis TaxID=420998 RepID=A0A0M6YDX5_9RHOB|nr:hypothetical protein [Jannaschia donghaensis]CTQ48552.1 hypothetical protein JDO7802_00554 [Jannaschia donghaensis]
MGHFAVPHTCVTLLVELTAGDMGLIASERAHAADAHILDPAGRICTWNGRMRSTDLLVFHRP